MNSPIIGPVVALAGWTMFIQGWMYAKRIPAIIRNNIKMDPNVPGSELLKNLPPEVRWKADNYNNLMEQPTVFYAVCFALALQGAGHGINAKMAWSYVAVRVAHSLVQVTFNNITTRFSLFMLGSAPLLGLVIQAAKNQFL